MSKEESLKELFLRLVEVQAPSGFEEPMMKLLEEELKPYVDEVYDTKRGNVIGVQRGTDPKSPKIAIVAHMDQIGFAVFNIDSAGFIRFRKLGGAHTRAIQGQQVQILTDKGPVLGVVGLKPGHITTPAEANILPPIEEMYIDVGARSREDAIKIGVRIGLPITYNTKPIELANGFIATPSIDDRCGIASLIVMARHFKPNPPRSTIYYIGTVEEEIGLRGAEVVLDNLDVDIAIAIDTTSAGYQPDVNMRDLFYEVEKGPALHVGELGTATRIGSQLIIKYLTKTAEKYNIPHQVGFQHGGTDAMALMQTGQGIHACTIALPRRYSHSPIETFQLEDLENLILILIKAVSEMDKGFNLNRI